MSVVVRMEMPQDKNCLLNFSLPKVGPWCWIEDRECDYYKTNNRPDWCPIICSLPEGHGRLIDAEARFDEFILNSDMNVVSTIHHTVGGILDDYAELIPTIVPAERSET